MRKLLRLIVACTINHDESYYQTGLQSKNIDWRNLTHDQIAAWKATCKVIEADMLIDLAFNLKVQSHIEDVDLSFLKPGKELKNGLN